ncbi:MAG: aminotransferase class I/II-fold pyridoxal phosphate-dependent enzyme [Pseudomonadales bacterium]
MEEKINLNLFPENTLAAYQQKYKPLARHFLSTGSVEPLVLQEVLQLANEAEHEQWQKLILDYTPACGDRLLREEISALYPGLHADNIVTFAGAQEALFVSYHALLNKGDQIAVFTPYFEPLGLTARGIGARVRNIPMEYCETKGWQPDLDFTLNCLTSGTKMAVLNFPHNPTGYLPSANELQQLVSRARDIGIWIFSDEVFRGLEFNRNERLPPVASLYEKSLSLGVSSKAYGLGTRLGWIATQDKTLIHRMLEIKEYLSICNSASDELLTRIVLRNGEKILQKNLQIIQSNINKIEQMANNLPYTWIPVKAGCLAFPLLRKNQDAQEYSKRLVCDRETLILPGHCFAGDNHCIRLGFGRRNFPLEKAI